MLRRNNTGKRNSYWQKTNDEKRMCAYDVIKLDAEFETQFLKLFLSCTVKLNPFSNEKHRTKYII